MMAMKMRIRKKDSLDQVIGAIQEEDLEKLKTILQSSPAILDQFKERLISPRVPKGHSPLVAVILKGNLEIFKYILDSFPTNLEQETSAIIEGGYPVEGATPLWTASTLGIVDVVKLLVCRGADIEHTTDSKSSPLRGAAFDGHCDVCEFLIERGADIDKPNQVGQSPLTIAAAMQKKDCVQLLIDKGADVNHKGHNGDTPLHVSVESGAVEIAKILVSSGAQNNPNDVGFTPAILACCYGHEEVMNYLHLTFTLSDKELYNCYCLLAAKEVLGNNSLLAERHMRHSIEIRSKDPPFFASLSQADPIYDGLEEPVNEAELQYVINDETRMFFLSSIYCERVLGRVHPTTAFYIRISGDMVLADDRYEKCIDLWHRSLDFDDAARMAYELQITEDLLFAVRGFSIMVENKFIPPVEQHFRWGLKEFRMAHESKISEIAVISCLFRMIAIWIKIAEVMEEKERNIENDKIAVAVDDLITAMKENPCPVLVGCLQNLPEHTSGAGKDIVKIGIPLHKAVALFLDRGCPIHCEDEDGNFPLHIAVKLLDDSASKCIHTLLEYGAHYDAVNFNRETALDLARSMSSPAVGEDVVEELLKGSVSNMTLQCLAARVVVEERLRYIDIIPKRVAEFVLWHEGDSVAINKEDKEEIPTATAKGRVIGVESVTIVTDKNCLIGEGASNGYILTHSQNLNTNSK